MFLLQTIKQGQIINGLNFKFNNTLHLYSNVDSAVADILQIFNYDFLGKVYYIMNNRRLNG